MALNTVTLTWDLADLIQSGIAATISLVPTAVLTDSTDHVVIPEVARSRVFTGGTGSLPGIIACDNSQITPAGWAYTITVTLANGTVLLSFNAFINFASGATQDLSSLTPVSSVTTMQAYLPLPSGTPQAGQVPVATGTGEASAWGNSGGGMSNPMTTLGDLIYENATPAPARLAGDTSNTRKFLRAQASGGVAQAPAWDTIQAADVPTLNQNTTGTAANVTGTVATANGGTGQTSAAAAYNALSPMTTLGDIEYESGANTASRLAGNTSATRNFLTQTGTGSVSAAPAWGTITSADMPAGTTGAKGALQLDGTAADISRPGLQAAGATGKAADGAHVHPFDAWQPSDSGLLTWNTDPGYGSNNTVVTPAGTMFVMAVKLAVAANVTNIVMNVITAGSGLTSGQCFAALYQGAGGALLGATADQSAVWNSTGLKTMALSGGPFAAAAGILYVGFWYNGTTGPAFSRGDNTQAKINAGLAAASSRWGSANTALTTTAPGTLGTIAAAGVAWWVALS